MLSISKGKSYAHFLPTFLSLKSNYAVFMPYLAIFPIISTNAYYGNGLASHTVKNLVNMRVLGFLNQFGRFTPFLFSCLFCQLFANFSKISRAKIAYFFKVWKAAFHTGCQSQGHSFHILHLASLLFVHKNRAAGFPVPLYNTMKFRQKKSPLPKQGDFLR